MDKKVLRKTILGKKSQISEEEILTKSKIIENRLYSMEEYKKSNFIFTFISFPDEVNTHNIIKNSINAGKRVGVPITIPKSRIMKVSELKDFDNELYVGFYNILTPKKEFTRIVSPDILDLVLVPGLAFDRQGYRVGYGGGYYDTFHSKLDINVVKIGLCLDMQVQLKVPTEMHDVPVDFLVTEKEIIKCIH